MPRMFEADWIAFFTSIDIGTITWQHEISDLSVIPRKSLVQSSCPFGFWIFDRDQ
jgi:hypothetical protein